MAVGSTVATTGQHVLEAGCCLAPFKAQGGNATQRAMSFHMCDDYFGDWLFSVLDVQCVLSCTALHCTALCVYVWLCAETLVPAQALSALNAGRLLSQCQGGPKRLPGMAVNSTSYMV